MTFTDALATIFNSPTRITRRTWNNPRCFVSVHNSTLSIYGKVETSGWVDDGQYHPLIVTESDFYGDDWEVVG